MSSPQTRGVIACVVFVAVTVLLTACGGGSTTIAPDPLVRSAAHAESLRWFVPPRRIAGLQDRLVGQGTRAAVVLWPRNHARPPRSVVVFIHGYEPKPPWIYGAWLRHITEAGSSIIYPVYQNLTTKPEDYAGNMTAGIAAGLRFTRADPRSVVAVGHDVGGVLAFDFAATAREAKVSPPRAVLAVYPGRNPPSGVVPVADLSRISHKTIVATITGPGDQIPGSETLAHALLSGARQIPPARRMAIYARDTDRFGPEADDTAARRSFWVPADRLIAMARGGGEQAGNSALRQPRSSP